MHKNIIHIILNYFKDKLSNKERHNLEKEVNTDPFLQDAMDGFASLTTNELESDLHALTDILKKRTENKKTKKLIPYFRIAAGIAIIIGIGATVIYTGSNFNKNKLAEQTQIEAVKEEIIPIKDVDNIKKELEEENLKKVSDKKIAVQEEQEAITTKEIIVTKRESTIEIVAMDEEAIIEDNFDIEISEEKELLVEMEDIDKSDIDNEIIAAPVSLASEQEENITLSYSAPQSAKMVLSEKIQGVIKDDTGEPIPFANITIKGTNKGAVSDIDGNFKINADFGDTLKIAYIGYETKEIPAEIVKLSNPIIKLNAEEMALNEVVVDYSANKKSDITESAVSIEPSLQGQVAGVSVEKKKGKRERTSSRKQAKSSNNTKHAIYGDNDYTEPYPVGGFDNFWNYIETNKQIDENKAISVTLEFMINIDNTVSDIKVTSSKKEQYSNEAIRLIENGPKWMPGKVFGEPEKLKYTITINL